MVRCQGSSIVCDAMVAASSGRIDVPNSLLFRKPFLRLKDNKNSMFSIIRAFSLLMIPSASETQSAGFWLEKGNELCNSGQRDEAIKAYDHALSIDRRLIDAWNNKGLVLASKDRFSEALQCFDEVLRLSPQ